MMETKELSIEGFDVRVTQHRARAAAKLLAKVGRVVAPGLAKIASGITDGNIKEAELEDIGPAVAALFEALDDDQLDAILLEVFKHATIVMPDSNGTLRVFDLSKGEMVDEAFTGRLPLMFKVAKFSLEVNFGSFFAANGALAALVAAAGKPSSST